MTRGFFEYAGAGSAGSVGRFFCTPKGIRTPVAGLKGLSPGPLDDGGVLEESTKESLPERQGAGQIWRCSGSF